MSLEYHYKSQTLTDENIKMKSLYNLQKIAKRTHQEIMKKNEIITLQEFFEDLIIKDKMTGSTIPHEEWQHEHGIDYQSILLTNDKFKEYENEEQKEEGEVEEKEEQKEEQKEEEQKGEDNEEEKEEEQPWYK